MEWLEIKMWLESSTGLDRDALHIYGAVFIQFCVALVFRRSLASPWPWIAVLIVAIANEYVDYQGVGESQASIAVYRAEGYKDLWNTMMVPTALMLIARYWPGWMIGKSTRPKGDYSNKLQSETAG